MTRYNGDSLITQLAETMKNKQNIRSSTPIMTFRQRYSMLLYNLSRRQKNILMFYPTGKNVPLQR